MVQSELESLFAIHLTLLKLPKPEREYKFDSVRRWRFDFCWPEKMVAVEIEGGVWKNGRHNRGNGYIADMDKYNSAVILGWRVLRFSGDHVRSGKAVNLTEQLVKEK